MAAQAQPQSLTGTGCVQDWRCVRAQLLTQEMAASRAVTQEPLWAPDLLWAHRLGHIEHGCLLISRQEDMDCFIGSVVLITWHGTPSVYHASTCIQLPRTPCNRSHEGRLAAAPADRSTQKACISCVMLVCGWASRPLCRGMCCSCADATGSMGLVLNRRGSDLIRHALVDLELSGEPQCL